MEAGRTCYCFIAVGVIASLFLALPAAAAPARFRREFVRLRVTAESVHVFGRYQFDGGRPMEDLLLRYPFAINEGQRPPNSVSIRHPGQGWSHHSVSPTVALQGFPTVLSRSATGDFEFEIQYQQVLNGRRASYLLTTARAWDSPIEHARLEVVWPDSLGRVGFSLPFRAVESREGETLYRYEAVDFVPGVDLVVEW